MDGVSRVTGPRGWQGLGWQRVECILEQGHIGEWLRSHDGRAPMRNPEPEGSPAQWTSTRRTHCWQLGASPPIQKRRGLLVRADRRILHNSSRTLHIPQGMTKGKWFLNPWWLKFFRDMKLKNKKNGTNGDKRLSQKGNSGGTNGNMSSRWSNDIIDTDRSPVELFPWGQLWEMRKTLEKTVKSKKTRQLDFSPDFTRSSNQMYSQQWLNNTIKYL